MINDKQSSIEWLTQQVVHLDWQFLTQEKKRKICEQAKTMHKEEIERAHYEGSVIVISKPDDDMLQLSQQYYNETYGGNIEQQ